MSKSPTRRANASCHWKLRSHALMAVLQSTTSGRADASQQPGHHHRPHLLEVAQELEAQQPPLRLQIFHLASTTKPSHRHWPKWHSAPGSAFAAPRRAVAPPPSALPSLVRERPPRPSRGAPTGGAWLRAPPRSPHHHSTSTRAMRLAILLRFREELTAHGDHTGARTGAQQSGIGVPGGFKA